MLPGTRIGGRFEVIEEMGHGGMARVFRAKDHHTGSDVALKALFGSDSDSTARFVREIRVLSDLRHPAIVRYVAHDVSHEGAAFLAMEWLEGEDLERVLARGPLSAADTVRLGIRVAEALGVAHAREVVHRDVKPSNIFVPEGNILRAKVLDFGIARSNGMAVTERGVLVGTVSYMSPEQVSGGDRASPRSDVFALGCVLFECITGTVVFGGDSVFAALAKIALAGTPRLREVVPDVSPDLDDLVWLMMSKKPEDRPRDGAAVAEALRALPPLSVRPAAHGSSSRSVPALGATEQRLVSIVVASVPRVTELLDATLLANASRAERDEAEATWTRVKSGVEASGGRLTRLLDGSVVVVLSGAKSATDLAVRAARCALSVRSAVPAAEVALATGRGVVSAHTPVGAVIDEATRLLRAAAADTSVVRLDDATYGLLDGRFDLGGDSHGLFLRGERDAEEEVRRLLGRPTTCVGRDRELAALIGIAAEAVEESVARAALVTGPVGVGKSRLRHELLKRLARDPPGGTPFEVWIARGDPVRAGAAFGLVAPMVRRLASIQEGEPLATRRSKLRARVARSVRGDALDRVTEFLGELASVPFADAESVQLRAARQEPLLMGDQMRRAFEDWLAGELDAHPVLLVIEDLHWGDLPTVQLIDALLRRHHDRPFMVLALARPEVTSLFPQLWSGRALTVMRLDGLSRRASERLVREVLGADVEAADLARILDRAGGNAFLLEELMRAHASRQPRESQERLPDTVLAMAQARLEGLPAETRRVLRAASVFGSVFWGGALVKLLGVGEREVTNLVEQLATLEEDEILERHPHAAFPGETEIAFRHALLREAAYGALTDEDRTLGHKLAGEWLEAMGEPEAVTLAAHFEKGREPARAIRWYRRAAEQALGGNDFAAVIARVERAFACGARGEELGALRLLEAEARRWSGEYLDAERAGLDALGHLRNGSAAWYAAAGEVVTACGLRSSREGLLSVARSLVALTPARSTSDTEGDALAAAVIAWSRAATWLLLFGARDLAERLFARIDATSEVTADPAVNARILYARSALAQCTGDPFGYVALSEASARAFEVAGGLRSANVQWQNVGNAHIRVGAFEDAIRVLGQALRAAERMGLHVANAKLWLGTAHALAGDAEEAERLLDEAVAGARAVGMRRVEVKALVESSRLALGRCDVARAETLARRAQDRATAPYSVLADTMLAETLLARGANAEARAMADRAARVAAESPPDEADVWIALVHAEAKIRTGDEAGADVDALLARVEARAARAPSSEARRRFLERIPEHARLRALRDEHGVGSRA